MRLALFFKLFKPDRAAAAVPSQVPAADEIAPAVATATVTATAAAIAVSLPAEAPAEADAAADPDRAPVIGDTLRAANSNTEAGPGEIAAPAARELQADKTQPADMPAESDAADIFASFASTADLLPHDEPIGQERALADLSRAAAVAGPGFHIAVVASPELLADAAIRRVLAEAPPPRAGDVADWVYVHNFDDASAPRALRLPAGSAPRFAAAVHEAVREAMARLDAAFLSDERVALRRRIDAETRDALDERLLAIKTRAEAQNLAVVRTPGGYVVAPVHEGKVVKPEVFARLPEAMRADVETRVRAMQDELAATLAERPAVERERRQRLAAADEELAAGAVEAAFADLGAAFEPDAAMAAHLDALGADLVATQLARTDAGPAATAAREREIPRRYRVNVFLTSPATASSAAARLVAVETQASASALVGHALRGERDQARAPDLLDLAPGAAHRAAGGVLYVDAGRLAHVPAGAAALEQVLATSQIAIDAGPALLPQPIPLAARIVVVGDRDSLQQIARTTPALLGRLRSTAHCAETTERTAATEAALAGRIAAAVAEHGLNPLEARAVAALVDIAARMAGEAGLLSCRIAPLIDIAREADVLARRDGRELVERNDIEAAASARENSLAALGAALAPAAADRANGRSGRS